MTVGLLSFAKQPLPNPFQINIIWDTTALAANPAVRSTISAAAAEIVSHVNNPITLNFKIGIGTVDGDDLHVPASNAGATAGQRASAPSYATIYAGLQSALTSVDGLSFIASLPVPPSTPPFSAGIVSSGSVKALGLVDGHDVGLDAKIVFGTDFNFGGSAFPDLYGIALHEMTHAMGRTTSDPWTYGCFDSSGVHRWAEGGYLSVDNGITNTASYAGFDSSFDNTGNQQHNDALRAAYTPGSIFNFLTTADLKCITTLGFNVIGTAAF